MLTRIDLRDTDPDARDLAAILPRADLDVAAALESVAPLIEDVRARGAAALRDAAERFDHVRPEHLRVPASAIERALAQLDPAVREGLELSIAHNRAGHAAQLPVERVTEVVPGGRVVQRWIPVRRVGLYAPGGLAVYPSSVVMNVVPAQVAGVERIALASPPQAAFGGLPHPTILAACGLLGVEEVYAVGGAQAIAMFAHGVTGLCAPVAMVTGPGNIYVVAAKRLLRGIVGIDSEAGPTEIAIIADSSANPAYVAADLISQAEHDPMAASVLITDSPELADLVAAELEPRAAATKHRERIRTALTGQQSAVLLVRDLDQAVEVADTYAAEHLEIQTRDAGKVASRIRNAGAIFVGDHSPVSLGDYSAGSTHVLPTAGCACHGSGLNVRSFMRTVHVIDYSAQALSEIADGIERFALAEDLPGHAAAITVRTRR